MLHCASSSSPDHYNPWPYYPFTGSLRPAPLGQRREVPESIPKPDYTYRSDGVSEGEQIARNKHEIKVGSTILNIRAIVFFSFIFDVLFLRRMRSQIAVFFDK